MTGSERSLIAGRPALGLRRICEPPQEGTSGCLLNSFVDFCNLIVSHDILYIYRSPATLHLFSSLPSLFLTTPSVFLRHSPSSPSVSIFPLGRLSSLSVVLPILVSHSSSSRGSHDERERERERPTAEGREQHPTMGQNDGTPTWNWWRGSQKGRKNLRCSTCQLALFSGSGLTKSTFCFGSSGTTGTRLANSRPTCGTTRL